MGVDLTTYPTNRTDADEAKWASIMGSKFRDGIYKELLGLNDFEVFADSTGMQIKIKTGMALLGGYDAELLTQQTFALSPANASNPRIDRAVLRLDRTDPATISLEVLEGVAAPTPTVPTLSNTSTIKEFPLAQIRVNALVSTITPTNITDERTYTATRNHGSGDPGIINSTVANRGTSPFTATRDHSHAVDELAMRKIVIPAGIFFPAGHGSIDSGFLACDGRIVSRGEFLRLWNKFGTKYGAGDGSSTFGLPNLTGLVLRGSASGQGVGVIGGADSTTLWNGQLPYIAPSVDGDSNSRVVVTDLSPGTIGGWYIPNTHTSGSLKITVSDIDEFGRVTPDPIGLTQRSMGVNWMVSI